MLNDDPPKLETAEERAQRIWRNNQLINEIIEKTMDDNIPQEIYGQSIVRALTQFKVDIRNFMNKQSTEILIKYLATIQSRKHILLKEKLRRLEMKANEDVND
jgi:ribosome maturation protein Sdo1